jgi:prolyl-tRNA synthetase
MLGVPIRLEVGPRDIEKGVVTLVRRDGIKKAVPMEGLKDAILKEADELQTTLYAMASQFSEGKVRGVVSIEEAKAQSQTGVALVPWCGDVDCGHQLETRVEANMLGEPQYQSFTDAACAVCGKLTGKRTYMARQY